MYHLDLPDARLCTHDGLTCLYHESTWGAVHCSVLLPLFFGLTPRSNWALGCMGAQRHHITSFLNYHRYVLAITFLQRKKKIVQVLLFIAQKAVENEDPEDEP